MLIASLLVAGLLVGVLACQTEWCRRFTAIYRKPRSVVGGSPVQQPGPLPKVAVVLTLRGADPFLDRCLRGLMQQDYPRYDVRIVVDHREDPAWEMVQGLVAEFGTKHLKVSELSSRPNTCSLRMSSLIQAVASLDESYDVVTFVDADAVLYSGWLRDLVAPLANPEVGATCGVRWYMPEDNGMGTLVRHLWNAAGVAQMHAFGIGWGGSLAVRRQLMQQANILEKWSQIMFEDTFTVNEVHKLGGRLEYVPAATIINRETIDLRGCTKFISRQVLNARLYHRSWPKLAAFAIAETVAFNGALVLGAAALIAGQMTAAGIIGAALGAYSAGMGGLLLWSEAVARKVARDRGEAIAPLSWKLIPAAVLTHFVYSIAAFMAVRVRHIEWRGIRYELRGPRKVHLTEYKPFRPHFQSAQAPVSL